MDVYFHVLAIEPSYKPGMSIVYLGSAKGVDNENWTQYIKTCSVLPDVDIDFKPGDLLEFRLHLTHRRDDIL